ncbi:hypothetical protein A3A74_06885 [Candidatus Roizmanbacteria bacterium RIFCSPLOWO2_01_FULL_35_13]|uniref:Glycosyltransferase RgtA/B/C/D-like domain-containing protein n=1 Tax=Candidatus Roizmanbacteria bacterium RIFCSPLOWO2_01_FULL_35_13 TaxID=1802055 RepID=A0A1F7IA11_9BACT|nr:MAG: hypothetical protein A3A74_06885 [Candidatus Roizmanbacteria bacterium RIFCSPLOWO2_01_FULL_35_13]
MKLGKNSFNFKFVSAVLLIIYAVFFFIRAKTYLDSDFGWGLRLGEIILKSGFPVKDPFSYTMPSYTYADHEWLIHVGMAKFYSLAGYSGLSLIFTFIIMSTILIVVRKSDIRFMPIQILFICGVLISYYGIRSQVITWLFFAILCRWILNNDWWSKYKFFVPVLFLFWANLHGGFIIGWIVLFVITIEKRKFPEVIVTLASILITLINPYGLELWKEVWIFVKDPYIRFSILEWRPILFAITSVELLSLAYCGAFILHYRKKYARHELILAVLLFLAAFSSARNFPLFIIYALILIRKGLDNFISDITVNKIRASRFHLFYVVFFTLVSVLGSAQLWGDYNAGKNLNEENFYPRLAVRYLSDHLPEGQIFSSYEWGGYLIWKLPQKKVFIDGRMSSMSQKNKTGESDYIFAEYMSLITSKTSLAKVFQKYKVDTVLLPRRWTDEKSRDIMKSYVSKFIKDLKKNNFKAVYQDKVAIILTKKIPVSTAASLEGE